MLTPSPPRRLPGTSQPQAPLRAPGTQEHGGLFVLCRASHPSAAGSQLSAGNDLSHTLVWQS